MELMRRLVQYLKNAEAEKAFTFRSPPPRLAPDGGPPPLRRCLRANGVLQAQTASADQPPRVIADLSGKRVKIGGCVITPLDFRSTTVKGFC